MHLSIRRCFWLDAASATAATTATTATAVDAAAAIAAAAHRDETDDDDPKASSSWCVLPSASTAAIDAANTPAQWPYARAIMCLRQGSWKESIRISVHVFSRVFTHVVSVRHSAQAKLQCLTNAYSFVMSAINDFWAGHDRGKLDLTGETPYCGVHSRSPSTVSGDDLLPIFAYIVSE
jgi:hypothetical protein